jgi:hypothetical protein
MNLNGRIGKLEAAIKPDPDDPFDGATWLDILEWGYVRCDQGCVDSEDGKVPRHRVETPPVGVQHLACALGLGLVEGILKAPDRLRADLKQQRVADEFRRKHGSPLVLVGESLARYEAHIAEADADAAKVREQMGLPAEGYDPGGLIALGLEGGLTESDARKFLD